MTGMKNKLAKGAVWIAAARIIVNLVAFASTLVLARLLTPSDFGLVSIASAIAFVIASITELSLSQALIQHQYLSEDHFHSAWTLNLARAALLAMLICGLAWPIAWFYSDPRLAPIMVVLGACTLLSGGLNPKLATFYRTLVFWQDFVLQVSQKIIGFIVAVAIALIWKSYWALIGSLIATQLCALVLSYSLIPYRPKLKLSLVRDLLSFSVWLSLGQAVNTINWRADQLAIGYLLGNGPLGFYTVGDNLAVLPTREATSPIAKTLFPSFSRMVDDPDRLRQAYQRSQSLLFAVALPIGTGFALIAHPLVLLTMGPKWLPSVFIIQLLSSIFALQTLSSTLQPLAMAMGKTRNLFARDVMNLLIRLPLIVAGIILGGLAGIVYARCISGTVSTFINMSMAKKLLGLSIAEQLKVNMRAFVSTVLMVILVWFANQHIYLSQDGFHLFVRLAVLASLGAISYVGFSFALWKSAGYPPGPEREIALTAGPLLKQWRGRNLNRLTS